MHTTQAYTIIPLEESRLDTAAEAMARAFMADPVQVYTFPDEAERRQKSPAHFRTALRYGLRFGEVYTTPGVEGAVVWLGPGQTEITPEKAEAGGFADLPFLLGEEAATRFLSVMDYLDPFHKEDVPEPHWYVMVVGVDPAHKGRGIGKALLRPGLEKAQRAGCPVYLETGQPSNVPFYTGLGFKVVRALKDPSSGLDLWTFRLDG